MNKKENTRKKISVFPCKYKKKENRWKERQKRVSIKGKIREWKCEEKKVKKEEISKEVKKLENKW